jgi:hypothetical protein
LGIWAAAAKTSQEKSLKVEEALKTYTVNAAYASFCERKKGTLEVGKFADFTILSEDLLKVEPNQIKNVSVVMTVVNGKVVYRNKGQLS